MAGALLVDPIRRAAATGEIDTVPGGIIGGRLGACVQGRISPRFRERAMAIVFLLNVTIAQSLTK